MEYTLAVKVLKLNPSGKSRGTPFLIFAVPLSFSGIHEQRKSTGVSQEWRGKTIAVWRFDLYCSSGKNQMLVFEFSRYK
jgi:hypothetical protein